MKKLTFAAQILLGLIYFVFGLNGFLNFIPTPAEIPEKAMAFSMAMVGTGYFLPFLKATEVVGGLMLLAGIAVPVSLVVLAPVTINIFLFHAFLTPGLENSVMSTVMVILHLLSAKRHWALYRPLFRRGH